ncbi:MAG: hypothetical protein AB1599_01365 [Planctomycetota bacterium]
MPSVEQVIVACASCGTQYNVSTMAPGAKFKCQKCATINIVPALQAPVEEAPPPPTPPPPPRPQPRPQVKTTTRPPAHSRISGSRIPAIKTSPLKKGRPSPFQNSGYGAADGRPAPRASDSDEEGEEPAPARKKSGLLAPQNRKYLYIGGAIVLVLLSMVYVMHSRSVAEKNKKINEQMKTAVKEINDLTNMKDYTHALEKSEAFIREFKEYDLPEVQKNVKNTEASLKGIEQLIERQKEGRAKLDELLDKKNNAAPEQFEELVKEFTKFMNKYGEFGQLYEKASSVVKDLQEKIAAGQEEKDNKIYNELMAEIKPMVDQGSIDAAITHLKKYWDNNDMSKRLQGALKKKLSELKAMK